MKIKYKLLITAVSVSVIFISGFILGRVIKPFRYTDVYKTETILDVSQIQKQFKLKSQSYLDSASNEMMNYSMKYYRFRMKSLPDLYSPSLNSNKNFL